jgi:hypothetical protein
MSEEIPVDLVPDIPSGIEIPPGVAEQLLVRAEESLRRLPPGTDRPFETQVAVLEAIGQVLSTSGGDVLSPSDRTTLDVAAGQLSSAVYEGLVGLGQARSPGTAARSSVRPPSTQPGPVAGLPPRMGLALQGLAPAVGRMVVDGLLTQGDPRLLAGLREAVVRHAVSLLLRGTGPDAVASARQELSRQWDDLVGGEQIVADATAGIDRFARTFATALADGRSEATEASEEMNWPASPQSPVQPIWDPLDIQAHAQELLQDARVPPAALDRVQESLNALLGPLPWRQSDPSGVVPALAVAWAVRTTLAAQGDKLSSEQRQGLGLGVADPQEVQLSAADRQALEEVYRQQRELVSWQVGERGAQRLQGVPGRSPDRMQLLRAGATYVVAELAQAWAEAGLRTADPARDGVPAERDVFELVGPEALVMELRSALAEAMADALALGDAHEARLVRAVLDGALGAEAWGPVADEVRRIGSLPGNAVDAALGRLRNQVEARLQALDGLSGLFDRIRSFPPAQGWSGYDDLARGVRAAVEAGVRNLVQEPAAPTRTESGSARSMVGESPSVSEGASPSASEGASEWASESQPAHGDQSPWFSVEDRSGESVDLFVGAREWADLWAVATERLRDSGLPERALERAQDRLDEAVGATPWGESALMPPVAVAMALVDASLQDDDLVTPVEGRALEDAYRRQQESVVAEVMHLGRESLARNGSGTATGVSDSAAVRLAFLTAGLTTAVLDLAYAWTSPLPPLTTVENFSRAALVAGPHQGGPGRGPVRFVRALRDMVRTNIEHLAGELAAQPGTFRSASSGGQMRAQLEEAFSDGVWRGIAETVRDLRQLPPVERAAAYEALADALDTALDPLLELTAPWASYGDTPATRQTAAPDLLARLGRWIGPGAGAPDTIAAGPSAPGEPGAGPTGELPDASASPGQSPTLNAGSWLARVARPGADRPGAEQTVPETATSPARSPRSGSSPQAGEVRRVRLPLRWGVIKGTALPPDDEQWRLMRQKALARITEVTMTAQSGPWTIPGSGSGSGSGSGQSTTPVDVAGRFGGPGMIGGYADATGVLSWNELSQHTLAAGVLIRLKDPLPVSVSAPSTVAHRVVLVFGKRSGSQAAGAPGPYLISSVFYDTNTDTYYVGVD